MGADTEISIRMEELAKDISKTVDEIAGEKTGFLLMTFPLDRHGTVNYISNCNRRDMIEQMMKLIGYWMDNMPDIPAHKKS